VLEAVEPRRHVLGIVDFGVMVVVRRSRSLGVLGYAAVAVGRWHEPFEAAADDAFAKLAGNVGDAWDGGAVPAHGGVRGQRHHTTTTCANHGTFLISFLFLR